VDDRRKSWTQVDDQAVVAHKAANKTVRQIAKEMGRTASAVSSRLAHLKRRKRINNLLADKRGRWGSETV
jgi:predicted transcriptional regulator